MRAVAKIGSEKNTESKIPLYYAYFPDGDFWIQKQKTGKIRFQMDSCSGEFSVKELRALIGQIQKAIKGVDTDGS